MVFISQCGYYRSPYLAHISKGQLPCRTKKQENEQKEEKKRFLYYHIQGSSDCADDLYKSYYRYEKGTAFSMVSLY